MSAGPGEDGTLSGAARYRMYVSGESPNSGQALANFTVLAERYLAPYSLEVVDVRLEPERALADGVIVTPTLVRVGEPSVHIIGTLGDTAAVLASLIRIGSAATPAEARVPSLIRRLLETEAELEALVAGQADAVVGGKGKSILLHDAQEALQNSMVHFRELANRDPLTGIANRRLFVSHLEHAVERSKRQKSRLALIYVDVDHFKTVNDSLGHEAGDLLLRAFSERLDRCLRSADMLARVGGDEFAVLLEDVGDRAMVERVAQKIQTALAEPFDLGGSRANVRASIGVGLFPDNAVDAEGLTGAADAAMYRAKRAGQGGFVVAD